MINVERDESIVLQNKYARLNSEHRQVQKDAKIEKLNDLLL